MQSYFHLPRCAKYIPYIHMFTTLFVRASNRLAQQYLAIKIGKFAKNGVLSRYLNFGLCRRQNYTKLIDGIWRGSRMTISASNFWGPCPKILQSKNLVFIFAILLLYCKYHWRTATSSRPCLIRQSGVH